MDERRREGSGKRKQYLQRLEVRRKIRGMAVQRYGARDVSKDMTVKILESLLF